MAAYTFSLLIGCFALPASAATCDFEFSFSNSKANKFNRQRIRPGIRISHPGTTGTTILTTLIIGRSRVPPGPTSRQIEVSLLPSGKAVRQKYRKRELTERWKMFFAKPVEHHHLSASQISPIPLTRAIRNSICVTKQRISLLTFVVSDESRGEFRDCRSC